MGAGAIAFHGRKPCKSPAFCYAFPIVSEHIDNLVSIEIPLHGVVPTGHWWEDDGSCWRAVCDEFADARGWRWRPENWKAFAKERPEGPLRDYYLPPDFADRIAAHKSA
jgi:hypothetical protein